MDKPAVGSKWKNPRTGREYVVTGHKTNGDHGDHEPIELIVYRRAEDADKPPSMDVIDWALPVSEWKTRFEAVA